MAARSPSYSKPQTTDEWKTRAHQLEDDAVNLNNEIADRETRITELEIALKKSESELQKKTANLDHHFNTLQATESQAGDAITEAKLEAQQAQEEVAQLKRSHAIALKDEQDKTEKARTLTASAYSDVETWEARYNKLSKERDEAVALNIAHDDVLKETQERFAELQINDAHGFLEIILAEVAPVLLEQDLDVTPQNILNQFLLSRNDEKLRRTASGISLDQQSLHTRNDSHHRLGGRKASLHNELDDLTDDEDDIDYLFEDTGKNHWDKPFEESSPLRPRKKKRMSWPTPNQLALPPMHDAPTQQKQRSQGTDGATSGFEHTTPSEVAPPLHDAPSQHDKAVQATEVPLELTSLHTENDALRRDITLLKAQLDAKPPTTIITESYPRKATVWENITQLPWWMKTLFAFMLALYACVFLAAYNERRKWLGANDLSWEITPYDLGRGYGYGSGYSYDYGGGYSTNPFIRWLADDVFQITRLPYD